MITPTPSSRTPLGVVLNYKYSPTETDAASYYKSVRDRLERFETGFWLFTALRLESSVAFSLQGYLREIKQHLSEFILLSDLAQPARSHSTVILNMVHIVLHLARIACCTCPPRSGSKEAAAVLAESLLREIQRSSFETRTSIDSDLASRWKKIERKIPARTDAPIFSRLAVHWALRGIRHRADELAMVKNRVGTFFRSQAKLGTGKFEG